jgi:hypothetical protein
MRIKSSPSTRHGGAWGERMYSSYTFTTSALGRGEWSASRPGRDFTLGERTPGTHCTGGWVGPRAGLDTEARGKILCPYRGSNPGWPFVQPVVRHYTAWANPTRQRMRIRTKNTSLQCVRFVQRIHRHRIKICCLWCIAYCGSAFLVILY